MFVVLLTRAIWCIVFIFPSFCIAEPIKGEDVFLLTKNVIKDGWWSTHIESGRRVNVSNKKLQDLLSDALDELDEIQRPWNFDNLYLAFEKEININKRVLILTVLASNRDPRSAILLKKIYDSNEKYDKEVRKIAFECLISFYIIPNSYGGGTHQNQIEQWWQQNKKVYEEFSLPVDKVDLEGHPSKVGGQYTKVP